ncbi:MAG: DNA-processing protein DprA, partial [Chitinophagaceae bacterium]
GFYRAEEEIKFIEKYKITPLFITDKAYPKRLLKCYDSPTLLYYRGDANLNAEKMIAVIGTRSHTDYAKQVTEKLIKELSAQPITIVSGLAFGVDAIAHKAALKNNLPTIGVLAHGLNQIYPPAHTGLAKDMVSNEGGLLTEFASFSNPDKHNFPTRNRIVAGMTDATIVIETGTKGGSMITAEMANGYNKDVFAVPGKITDTKSAGCNYLIKNNKAILLGSGEDVLETLGWRQQKKTTRQGQRQLFIELTPNERIITDLLKEKESLHIDEINSRSGLSSSAVAAAILNMELQGIISSKPGKLYSLS